MNIAILGAGGVGGYYGGLLARAGHSVALLARGDHLDALRRNGLEVRTPEETFTVAVHATDDPENLGQIDLAVIAVKSYSLPDIAPAARHLAGKSADILPLLNGVEAADRLVARGVPGERVLGGLTEISATRIAPGVIERRSSFQRVVVGELRGGLSERTERIAAAFQDAGARGKASEDITLDLWRKLTFIASASASCGLARSSIGTIRDAPLGRLLIERAIREVVAVGRAFGVGLTEDDVLRTLSFFDGMAPGLKPSYLLDLESGGDTEADDLFGAVSRLGRLAGVETPVHDVATAALGGEAVMTLPYGAQSMVEPLRRVLVKRPDEAFGNADPAVWNYTSRPDLDEARREHDALVEILRSAGAEVIDHPEAQPERADSIFVFDPVIVTDRGSVVLRMGKELRRGEEAALALRLQEAGVPVLGELAGEATAEGGDLLWLDRQTLAVGQGFRTNAEGLRQLRDILEVLGVEVLPVELPYFTGPAACLHLLSLISLVDHDLAVVYPSLLAVPFWKLLQDRGIRLVEVPEEEFPTMGPNVLALAPRKCLMLEGNPVTRRRLEEAGCEVLAYKGQEISFKAEGGPTCLTRPVWRSSHQP